MWENQHHSLTTSSGGALNASAKQAKMLSTIYKNMFEPRISAGTTENIPISGRPDANISTWSWIWKVMQRNVSSSVASWLRKQLSSCTKLQLHALMTINSNNKNWHLLENCQKSLNLARTGRPDILWSANKLARSITKWTRACDRRLIRLISYIHHTCEYKQSCLLGNTAQQCRLGLFQDSDFGGDLEDVNSTSGGTLCVFWKPYICSNQLDV